MDLETTMYGMYAINFFFGLPAAFANKFKHAWLLLLPIGSILLVSVYFFRDWE